MTFFGGGHPLFFVRAKGAEVWDIEGREFLDWTSFFGVVLLGHRDAQVEQAAMAQLKRLPHAMGDCHPAALKVEALASMAEMLGLQGYQGILSLSGAEAVESLVKTVQVATGKPKLLCFEHAYHGLSLGTLPLTAWEKFRKPFFATSMPRVPFPTDRKSLAEVLDRIDRILRRDRKIGGVLLEPIQGRGGVRTPPQGFFRELAALCRERRVLFCTDEVFTGCYRAGFPLYTQSEGVLPDCTAVGKALGNGLPISACFAKRELMQKWGKSAGEALHTSTYLGWPLGLAAAIAVCKKLREPRTQKKIQRLSKALAELKVLEEHPEVASVRGRGLMWGIEWRDARCAARFVKRAERAGHLLLSCGAQGEVVSLTPPLALPRKSVSSLLALA